MEYLKDNAIGKVLAMGLAEVYRKNPAYPIDYFAKWLLNHEKQEAEQVKEVEKISRREERLGEIEARKRQEEQQRQEQLELQQARDTKEKQFQLMVTQHQYHQELLDNQLPSQMEKECHLSGVYVGLLDYPDKTCDVE